MSIRHLKLVFAHVCVAQLPVEGVAFLCKTFFAIKSLINRNKSCYQPVIIVNNHKVLLLSLKSATITN